jgi:hypothetical protein
VGVSWPYHGKAIAALRRDDELRTSLLGCGHSVLLRIVTRNNSPTGDDHHHNDQHGPLDYFVALHSLRWVHPYDHHHARGWAVREGCEGVSR